MTAAAIRHLLVASDGSEYSAGADRVAIDAAKHFGAKLTAMSMVLLGDDLEGVGTRRLLAEQDDAAQARLDALARQAKDAGVPCETELRHGEEPYAEIASAAEELGANLIVMGRRGRRGLARLMVGDATVKVIGQSPCHVLVVPRGAALWQRRILLATDGSAHGTAAADAAIAIAGASRLPMTVVSATVKSHSEERRREARDAVETVCRRAAVLGIDCDPVTVEGRPDEAILAQAASSGADLIVIGSHGRTGLAKILLGSVSERVIGGAQCPVLVART